MKYILFKPKGAVNEVSARLTIPHLGQLLLAFLQPGHQLLILQRQERKKSFCNNSPFMSTVSLPLFTLQRMTVPSKQHSLYNNCSYCMEKQSIYKSHHTQKATTTTKLIQQREDKKVPLRQQSLYNFSYCKKIDSRFKTTFTLQ